MPRTDTSRCGVSDAIPLCTTFSGECRCEYSTMIRRYGGRIPPGALPCHTSPHPRRSFFFLCECRRDYSLQRSWSRVRIPPAPPIRGCSSAVEHENVPSPSSQFFFLTMNAVVISGYPPVAARSCRFESGHPSGCGGIGRRTFDHGTARHGLFLRSECRNGSR